MSLNIVIDEVLAVYKTWSKKTTVAQMRDDWDSLFTTPGEPRGVSAVDAGGVAAAWICGPDINHHRVMVYFHGGGFMVGSIRSHFDLMYRLSCAAGCRVLAVDYRLAPEHRFPAALEDAFAAYQWLLSQGVDAADTVLAGDSAGGGLALSLLLHLKEGALPLPAAAGVMSAWTDLTAGGESYHTRAHHDPIHQRQMILAMATNYLGGQDPSDPRASPLFGDLSGLPPILLQVGDRETVLDDSKVFAEKARAAGVSVELEVYDGMIHVFQQFFRQLPQATEAIDSMGQHFKKHWAAHCDAIQLKNQEDFGL